MIWYIIFCINTLLGSETDGCKEHVIHYFVIYFVRFNDYRFRTLLICYFSCVIFVLIILGQSVINYYRSVITIAYYNRKC